LNASAAPTMVVVSAVEAEVQSDERQATANRY